MKSEDQVSNQDIRRALEAISIIPSPVVRIADRKMLPGSRIPMEAHNLTTWTYQMTFTIILTELANFHPLLSTNKVAQIVMNSPK